MAEPSTSASSDDGLSGAVAIVTGAAGGLGSATAALLAERGASVMLADTRETAAQAVADAISGRGGSAVAMQLDVRVEEDWQAVLDRTRDVFGGLSILVNNAAIHGVSSFRRLAREDWDAVIRTNLTSIFLGCSVCVPAMMSRGGGSIINIGSAQAALMASADPSYGAAKAAVRSLTMSLAAELGPQGIRVNTVHPGFMRTAMINAETEQFKAALARIPLRRAAATTEVAEAVAFLASSSSSYITGSELVVDGGAGIVPLGYSLFQFADEDEGA